MMKFNINYLIGHDNKIQKRAIVDNGSQSKDVRCLSLTKRFGLIASLVITLFISACQEDNVDTAVLPNTKTLIPFSYKDYYHTDDTTKKTTDSLIDSWWKVIDSLKNADTTYKDLNFDTNLVTSKFYLEGTYRFYPVETIFCSVYNREGNYLTGGTGWEPGYVPFDLEFIFRFYSDKGTVSHVESYAYNRYNGVYEEYFTKSPVIFCAGKDSVFNIAFIGKYNDAYGPVEVFMTISGQKQNNTIRNMLYIMHCLKPGMYTIPKGDYRIFRDKDGVSEQIDWAYNAPVVQCIASNLSCDDDTPLTKIVQCSGTSAASNTRCLNNTMNPCGYCFLHTYQAPPIGRCTKLTNDKSSHCHFHQELYK